MIEFIKGKIIEINPVHVVIDNNGVGYSFFISLETYNQFKGFHDATVYTYLSLSNEQLNLFGFSSREEREFFRKLINVSGIGPKLAIRSLSQVSYRDFTNWIVFSDEKAISSISGIGKKTASKIILELNDKLTASTSKDTAKNENTPVQDAKLALESLGFDSNKVSQVLKQVYEKNKESSLEDLIKLSLKLLNTK